MVNAHSCGTGCASGTEQADSVCSGANTAKDDSVGSGDSFAGVGGRIRAAVMNEWNHSKRLGEDALRRLMDLSVQLGRKALLFQQADMEYRSVLSHVNTAYGNAVNMLNVLQNNRTGEIMPAHSATVAVVSDPLSAMAAVYRVQDAAPPDGSPATLVQAMQPEPVAWRFTDPSFRGRRGSEPVVS